MSTPIKTEFGTATRPTIETNNEPQDQTRQGSYPIASKAPGMPSRIKSYSPEPKKAKYTSSHQRTNAKKKLKSNVHACDACAVRKVKCENQRPCAHCVTNNLTCTSLRERKKSGPKNLHRKTLDCINYLNEVIETNYTKDTPAKLIPGASAGTTFTSVSAPDSKSSSASVQALVPSVSASSDSNDKDNSPAKAIESTERPLLPKVSASPEPHDYKPTPANLIENLALIGEEPIIFELLKPLTVQSLLMNHTELVDFLSTNFNRKSLLESDINLLTNHDDSIFLSKLLIVLSLNLIIAEILIKLKKQKFKDFIKYTKKNLFFRNFKNFKNLCHFKCMEINTLIEKNFIVPPIIPQNNPKNINNINSNHLNQYQIYYNLSLSCLHLCNYYHTLNLTNTLNTSSNSENNYGNEAQEHHKLINLRKSISYYQLINLKTSDNAVIVQLYELFEILFTYERFYLIYSSNNYNLNLVRNNDILIQLSSRKILKHKVENINNAFDSNILFDLIYLINEEAEIEIDLFNRLCRYSNFNVSPTWESGSAISISNASNTLEYGFTGPGTTVYSPAKYAKYFRLKKNILQLNNADSIFDIIKGILIFKIWLVNTLPFSTSKKEAFYLVKYLSYHLSRSDNDLFKVQMSNYQLLQPLLHLLKVILEMKEYRGAPMNQSPDVETNQFTYTAEDDDNDLLIAYSDNLIMHFPFFNNINKLIRATKVLSSWFLNLNENRQKQEELRKTGKKPGANKPGSSIPPYDLVGELDASRIRLASNNSSKPVTNRPTPDLQHMDFDYDDQEYFSINPKVQHGPRLSATSVDSSQRHSVAKSFSESGSSVGSSGASSGTSSVVSASIEAYGSQSQSQFAPVRQNYNPLQMHNQLHQPQPHSVATPLSNPQQQDYHGLPQPSIQEFSQSQPALSSHTNTFIQSGHSLPPQFHPQTSVPQELLPHTSVADSEFNSASMSESTKNLYSLFNSISDDFMGESSASMTNLFQLNSGFTGFTPVTPGAPPGNYDKKEKDEKRFQM